MPIKRSYFAAALLAVCLAAGVSLRGDGTFSPRAQRIGDQLICMCGCTQNALTCNTLNCTVKLKMQAEIRQRAQSTDSDALVLQSFVQEYGTEVLANPTTQGFNLLAWIMPWIVLGFGLALVIYFVKRWRREAEPVPAAGPAGSGGGPGTPAIDRKLRAKIAAELGRFEDDLDQELKR
ncbi:MAG TPA: cytochrome c-type biogenesis protein CcmH [Terriglobales bacterium]|nr:cytochrome c-type biogenesis protein CcmH [Terriglobales bacterium]